MKKFFGAVFALAALFPAYSQLGLRIEMNRKVYMLYEPIYACISLRNNSGRPLVFGQNPKLQGFIYFLIQDSKGRTIAKRPGTEISATGLLLKPGESRNLVLPVNEYYELEKAGSYTINVCVAHNLLPRELKSSRSQTFAVENGVEVWSAVTGVPDITGSGQKDAPVKERKYSIRLLSEPPNKYYYLFVEDDKMVYGVSRIGRQISIEKFKAEVDMLGRIHILMPMSSKVFHYLAFSIDGMNIASSYWRVSDTIPTIYRDPGNGIVRRLGGVEAKRGVDYVEFQGTPASQLVKDGEVLKAAEGQVDLNKDISMSRQEE